MGSLACDLRSAAQPEGLETPPPPEIRQSPVGVDTWRTQRRDANLTCFGLHGEVGLPLQDGVDELGIVSEHGVVGVRGHHPGHRGACWGGGLMVIWRGVPGGAGPGFSTALLISNPEGGGE